MNPGDWAALADIAILWTGIAAMILVFAKAGVAAGLLQVPYLVWVSFAAVLNAAFLRLNPSRVYPIGGSPGGRPGRFRMDRG